MYPRVIVYFSLIIIIYFSKNSISELIDSYSDIEPYNDLYLDIKIFSGK